MDLGRGNNTGIDICECVLARGSVGIRVWLHTSEEHKLRSRGGGAQAVGRASLQPLAAVFGRAAFRRKAVISKGFLA